MASHISSNYVVSKGMEPIGPVYARRTDSPGAICFGGYVVEAGCSRSVPSSPGGTERQRA